MREVERFSSGISGDADASGTVVPETHFAIDPANGNLTQVVDAEGNVTDYEYSPNGDVQFVRDPRPGQVAAFAYDIRAIVTEARSG